MQLQGQVTGKMSARLIEQDMPAGHQEQSAIPGEEEAGGVGQARFAIEGADEHGAQQQRVDRWFEA
ncbi:hypothetical protein D3C77_735770 [compost metagenome]